MSLLYLFCDVLKMQTKLNVYLLQVYQFRLLLPLLVSDITTMAQEMCKEIDFHYVSHVVPKCYHLRWHVHV